MNAIEIHSLTKRYKDLIAVNALDLTVLQGELFALLGVNGAGKTTTIKMLTGLTRPTEGDAVLMGNSIVSAADEVKKAIALSPQETAVAPNLTVQENLSLMAELHGVGREDAARKVEALLKEFSLTEVRMKRAKTLSGGMSRRLSIAMALITEPEILFLDEPTLGLDVIARSQLWDTIRALKEKITIILTTHYMEEAEALSDRIGIMKDGRLLVTGTANEIKAIAGCERFEDAFVKLVKEGR